jgi:transposase-like protein
MENWGGTTGKEMKQKRYSAEQKQWAIKQLQAPVSRTVAELARTTGITEVSLRTWLAASRAEAGQSEVQGKWSSAEKFRVVLETAPMSQEEVAQYCRGKSILPEQLQQWRRACEQANAGKVPSQGQGEQDGGAAQQRIRGLERELKRKTEALAETAALLVLRKKADAIWGTGEDA